MKDIPDRIEVRKVSPNPTGGAGQRMGCPTEVPGLDRIAGGPSRNLVASLGDPRGAEAPDCPNSTVRAQEGQSGVSARQILDVVIGAIVRSTEAEDADGRVRS